MRVWASLRLPITPRIFSFFPEIPKETKNA
jgi:hypothetical protein